MYIPSFIISDHLSKYIFHVPSNLTFPSLYSCPKFLPASVDKYSAVTKAIEFFNKGSHDFNPAAKGFIPKLWNFLQTSMYSSKFLGI